MNKATHGKDCDCKDPDCQLRQKVIKKVTKLLDNPDTKKAFLQRLEDSRKFKLSEDIC